MEVYKGPSNVVNILTGAGRVTPHDATVERFDCDQLLAQTNALFPIQTLPVRTVQVQNTSKRKPDSPFRPRFDMVE